jgi:hypothetical protein
VDSEFEHTENILSNSEELESEDNKSVDSSHHEELKGNHEGLITSYITYHNAGEQDAANKIEQEVDAEDDIPKKHCPRRL